MIYLIGSLRNPQIPIVANRLREAGFEVFDDWYSAGFEADDMLRDYEKGRGHNIKQALEGYAAQHIFDFDLHHLTRADTVVLLAPFGKSAGIEFGWALGKGKAGYILFDQEPERLDVMMKFATGIFYAVEELVKVLQGSNTKSVNP